MTSTITTSTSRNVLLASSSPTQTMNLTGSVNVTTGAVTKGMELLFFQITVQYYTVYERHACCLFIDQTVVISAASVGSVLGILLMVMVALLFYGSVGK